MLVAACRGQRGDDLRIHLRIRQHLPPTALGKSLAHLPSTIVLPHPSPRNNGWLKQHPWLEAEFLPVVRQRIAQLLAVDG